MKIVLSHFDFREATAILRILPTWNAVVVSNHYLKGLLDFSRAKRKLSACALQSCADRLASSPSQVTSRWLGRKASALLCKELEGWTELSYLKLDKDMTDVSLLQFSFPHLKTLKICRGVMMGKGQFYRIVKGCPQLITVMIEAHFQEMWYAEDPWMHDDTVCLPNLTSLYITGVTPPEPILDRLETFQVRSIPS